MCKVYTHTSSRTFILQYTYMYVYCTYLIQHEGSYLARGGWERFADAQNCTVYRKRHLTSGLYMYKGTLYISTCNYMFIVQ